MPKKPRIDWSESARADLLAIIAHISDDNPQAAQVLLNEIEHKVAALQAHPKKYAQSKRARGYRQLTVRNNYLVFYRLLSEATPEVIDIVAVVHARRQWPQ